MEHAPMQAHAGNTDWLDIEDLEALDQEIGRLAATINAANHRLITLIGEMDRRGSWTNPLDPGCFRSSAHWLSHRIGLELGAAREHVRVARALPGLPQLSEAFERGVISYSKVRAVTRVATPETEASLLHFAKAGSAAQVETLVRRYRRASRVLENARAAAKHEDRSVTYHYDESGMLVLRARLPPEEGALVIKALETIRDELWKESRERLNPGAAADQAPEASAIPEPTAAAPQTATATTAPEVSPVATPEAAPGAAPSGVRHPSLEPGSDGADADAARPSPLPRGELSAETSPEPTSAPGPASVPGPAQEPEAARSPAAPGPPQAHKAPLQASFPSHAARPLPRIPERHLAADALVDMASRALAAKSGSGGDEGRYTVVVHIDAEVLAAAEADGRSELEDGPSLAPDTVRWLLGHSAFRPMWHHRGGECVPGRRSRFFSGPLRRALAARDGTRCAVPGCPSRGRDAHHVEAWLEGGTTSLPSGLLTCKYHHTLIHGGALRLEPGEKGRWRFLDRHGRELTHGPPLPAVEGDAEGILMSTWVPEGAEITPYTGESTWDGEPVDYDWAVEELLDRAGLL